jgi:hypothetical protein
LMVLAGLSSWIWKTAYLNHISGQDAVHYSVMKYASFHSQHSHMGFPLLLAQYCIKYKKWDTCRHLHGCWLAKVNQKLRKEQGDIDCWRLNA